jgi:hypothetical protein
MKLKTLIVTFLAVPFLAFTQETTTCYKANVAIPSSVPSIFCLESIYETSEADVLVIDSKDHSLPGVVSIKKFSRHNEDRYSFTAEKVITDIRDSGCGYSVWAVLRIEGFSNVGQISTNELAISVDLETTNDNCQTRTISEKIIYSKL